MSACRLTAFISGGKGRAPGPAAQGAQQTLPEKPVCCSAPRRYGVHILGTVPPNCPAQPQVLVFLGSAALVEPDERRRGVAMIFFARREENISKQHSSSASFVSSREPQTHGDGAEPQALPAARSSPGDGERGRQPALPLVVPDSTFAGFAGCSPAACRSGLYFTGCYCSLSLDLINFSGRTCSLGVPKATAG